MTNNKVSKIIDEITTDLIRCKVEDINLRSMKDIRNDIQHIKEKITELEGVVNAYILVLE